MQPFRERFYSARSVGTSIAGDPDKDTSGWARVGTCVRRAGTRVIDWYARDNTRDGAHPRFGFIQIAYGVLLAALLLYTHSWPAPDVIAVLLLVFALLAARGIAFLRDWSPFVLLVLGYVALTGVVPGLEERTHIGFPIQADRLLFGGQLPTTWLQVHFYHPGHASWYDYGATLLYPMHFVVPLVLAFVLWMWRGKLYWRFVSSYILLCYAGFLTYLVYPMAPPWWAAAVGRLPPIQPILAEVRYDGINNPIVLVERYFQPNPVAAMPSLHAAFPLLVFLVIRRVWPRWGNLSIVYPIAMSTAVVYLGQHYVIDVIAGWVYAIVAYSVVWNGPPTALLRRLGWRRQMQPAPSAALVAESGTATAAASS